MSKPNSVLWMNFLVHEKLDPKNMADGDVHNFLKLTQFLGEKDRPYFSPYVKRLESRRLICEAAIDLSLDLTAIKRRGKPLIGRGLLDVWLVVYKERFGSAVGTAGWSEVKRRTVVTKLGHGPKPRLDNDTRRAES